MSKSSEENTDASKENAAYFVDLDDQGLFQTMKKEPESSVNGHNYDFFLLYFLNLGHLECYIALNGM